MSDFILRDKQHIWHPFTPLIDAEDPIMITSAEGVYLNTYDGRKIIDAISSWWVNLHGHSNPFIAKAIALQASVLEHVIFAGFTHEPAIKLAENLLKILPNNQSKIFYSDNGSTAVEVSLKMAMQYWFNKGIHTKKNIIALKGAYHGDTFGAMSIGDRSIFTDPFAPYLFDVKFIDFPDQNGAAKALSQFKKIIASEDVAAFIFEPLVQAASGMRIYEAVVLDELIQLAKEKNVICIADEVFTGFGRTGKLFASHYLNNKPDIITLSKGLTGGTMPLGVTACSNEIIEAFQTSDFTKTFFHGHSYTANPLACATANASFELLTNEQCQKNILRISSMHLDFKGSIETHPSIQQIKTLGTILAIEIKNNEATSYSNSIRKGIYKYFLGRNILLRPLGNIIYILPPYVISNDELKSIYKEIKTFLDMNQGIA
jgi:adenosylmethionine-8-amino-7-oxononanoate aminotransferase